MTRSVPVLWFQGWSMRPELSIFPDRAGAIGGIGNGAPLTVSFDQCATPEDFDRVVRARIQAVPGMVDVVAWSLGGLVALRVAADFPLKMRRLVLIAATPRFTADPESGWSSGWPARVLDRMQRRLAVDRERVLRDFREALFTEAERQAGWPTRLQEISPLSKLTWSNGALVAGLDYLAGFDVRDRVAEIKAPVLVAHGAQDQICPAPAGRWLADHLRRAEWVELGESGHAPFLTQPEQVRSICRRFLA